MMSESEQKWATSSRLGVHLHKWEINFCHKPLRLWGLVVTVAWSSLSLLIPRFTLLWTIINWWKYITCKYIISNMEVISIYTYRSGFQPDFNNKTYFLKYEHTEIPSIERDELHNYLIRSRSWNGPHLPISPFTFHQTVRILGSLGPICRTPKSS